MFIEVYNKKNGLIFIGEVSKVFAISKIRLAFDRDVVLFCDENEEGGAMETLKEIAIKKEKREKITITGNYSVGVYETCI